MFLGQGNILMYSIQVQDSMPALVDDSLQVLLLVGDNLIVNINERLIGGIIPAILESAVIPNGMLHSEDVYFPDLFHSSYPITMIGGVSLSNRSLYGNKTGVPSSSIPPQPSIGLTVKFRP